MGEEVLQTFVPLSSHKGRLSSSQDAAEKKSRDQRVLNKKVKPVDIKRFIVKNIQRSTSQSAPWMFMLHISSAAGELWVTR